MRKTLLLSTLLALTAQAQEDDWSLNNDISVYGDYAFMKRALAHGRTLVFDTSDGHLNSCGTCEHTKECNTKNLVSRMENNSGYKVGGNYSTKRWSVEGSYLWFPEWTNECEAEDPGFLSFTNDETFLNDYSNADRASTHYRSFFETAEANYWRNVTPRKVNYFSASWILGIRYFSLNEGLDIAFTKGGNKSNYDIDTKNFLMGVQGGGALQWNPTKWLSWDLVAKVGTGYDWTSQKTFLGDLNNTVIVHDYETLDFAFPVFVDGSLTLSYQWFHNINLHAAYEFLYFNGVVLAADQVVKHASGRHPVDANGVAIIYGLTAGIGISF